MNGAILKLHILVVEDVGLMRMLVVQALENLGFPNVYEAEDGEDALRLLEKSSVDMIITDIEMKPMGGLDLIKHVRAGDTPLPGGVPALILSGLDDTSTLAAATELDVQGFLEKPVSANQLRERIESAMNATTEFRTPDYYRSLVFVGPAEHTKPKGGTLPVAGYSVRMVSSKPQESPAVDRHAQVNEVGIRRSSGGQRRRLPIEELQEGMVLQEDILSRGRLLLREGVVFTPGHVLVLRDMRSLLDQSDVEIETRS